MNIDSILIGLQYLKKKAAVDIQTIMDTASKYYDDNDPRDVKKRWSHVKEVIDTGRKIRGRELTPVEMGMLAFHDSAYRDFGGKKHPINGARIFRKEAPSLGFTPEETHIISNAIRYHMNYPRSNYSPLYKNDLQLLMWGADEGKPLKRRNMFKRHLQKALDGWYPDMKDVPIEQVPERLADRIRKQPHNLKRLQYHDIAYPGYAKALRDYIYSDDIIADYKDMLRTGEVKPRKF